MQLGKLIKRLLTMIESVKCLEKIINGAERKEPGIHQTREVNLNTKGLS